MGATILGFALGEPILRSLHHLFAFAGIDGGEFVLLPLCYGLAALSLARLSLREAPKPPPSASVWAEIGEGLQVLRQVPSVRGAMLHLVLLYSLLAALYVLALQLAALITSLGPSGFGALLAMSGVGMAIGAIVIAQMGHRFSRRRLTASGLGTITWTLVLLSQLRGSLVFTLTLCGILGIGAAMVAIPAQTTIQEETPEAERGRVFGLQNNLINIALSLPLVLAGTLVSSLGLKPVLFILAGLALIAALLEKPWQRC
jgi:predicted MFS family arabinose efflux permease